MAGNGTDLRGEQLLEVSNAISALKREYYGRGPEQARAHFAGDMLVVILRGGFTTVERTFLEAGEQDLVRQVRLRFQELMADPFRESVARITGRPVLGYMSQLIFETETIVELFHLGSVDDASRAPLG
jgi:uncharacterized protein YbcI